MASPYSRESDLRYLTQLSPDEQAESDRAESLADLGGESPLSLHDEIARAPNAAAREVLRAELAARSGGAPRPSPVASDFSPSPSPRRSSRSPDWRIALRDSLGDAQYEGPSFNELLASFDAKPEAPKARRNAFAVANDTAIDIANAAAGLAKAGVDLFDPASGASQAIGDFIKEGRESQSDWKKQQEENLRKELASADGEFDKAGKYVKHKVMNDPLGLASEIVGNAAPFVLTGGALGALSTGARTAATMGLASGLTAGEVRGNIFEKISNTPDEQLIGESPEYRALRERMGEKEAKEIVGASIINNIPELAVAAGVGALGGKYGFEGMMAGVAPKMGGRLMSGAVGVIDEATQGATEQLASNYGVRRVLPSQSLTEDVGLNAAAEGILGVGGVARSMPVQPAVQPADILSATDVSAIQTAAKALDSASLDTAVAAYDDLIGQQRQASGESALAPIDYAEIAPIATPADLVQPVAPLPSLPAENLTAAEASIPLPSVAQATPLQQQYEAAKTAGDASAMRLLAPQINAEKQRNTKATAERKKSPVAFSIGKTPANAEPITVRDGVVHVGEYPAQNFETGENVSVPQGANHAQIERALRDAGAVPKGQKFFGLVRNSESRSTLPSAPDAVRELSSRESPEIAGLLGKELPEGGKAGVIDDIRTLPGAVDATGRRMSRKTAEAIRFVSGMFGRSVVFYEATHNVPEGMNLDGKTLFVNVDSGVDAVSVAGHEFVHSLEYTDKEAYGAALDAVKAMLAADDARASSYAAYYKKPGMKDEALARELLSDIGGNLWRDEAFFADMFAEIQRQHPHQEARSIISRLRDALVAFLNKLIAATPKQGFQLEERGIITREELTSIRDRIVKMAADAFVAEEKARVRGETAYQAGLVGKKRNSEPRDKVIHMADKDSVAGTQAPTSAGDGSPGGDRVSSRIISGVGDDLVVLYHGTTSDGLREILSEGLIRGGNYFGVAGNSNVALTPSREVAEGYSSNGDVVKVRVPKAKLIVDPESNDNPSIDDALRNGSNVYAVSDIYLNEQAASERSDVVFSARRQAGADKDTRAFVSDFLRELSFEDAAFRYPISTAQTLEGNILDALPGAEYLGEDTRPDEREESQADRRYVFAMPDEKIFYVYSRGKDYWIDVSRLQTGDQGGAVYHGVANFARNTGNRFIGDPNGLSEDAIIRRTSAMLSSALRFGTTEHIEPAAEQLKGVPEKGIEPLDWRGDDVAKTEALVHTFLTTLQNKYPEIKNWRYDFATRKFETSSAIRDGDHSGGRLGGEASGAMDGRGLPGLVSEARAGMASLRRGILIQSLMASESSQRPELLEHVLSRSAQLASEEGGLNKVFSTQRETQEAQQDATRQGGVSLSGNEVDFDAAGQFWNDIEAGKSDWSRKEIEDVYAQGRRGSRRAVKNIEGVAGEPATPDAAAQATVAWDEGVAGFNGYATSARRFGKHFVVSVVPEFFHKSTDYDSKTSVDSSAVVQYVFTPMADGRYELSVMDPLNGGRAYNNLRLKGRLNETGGRVSVVLDNPYRESRAFLQESVRRLALADGAVPVVVEAGREGGARAGSTEERQFSQDQIKTKFSTPRVQQGEVGKPFTLEVTPQDGQRFRDGVTATDEDDAIRFAKFLWPNADVRVLAQKAFIPDLRYSAQRTPAETAELRDFLNGTPLARLQTSEAPHQGAAKLREWAVGIFRDYGFYATNPELGKVLMDERSVRDSMAHGKMNPFKAVAFKAVPEVIERGKIVHSESNKDLDSFYISAPVEINNVQDVVTVLVHRDVNTQRMYLHSVTTKENLLSDRVSGADAEASERSGSSRGGGIRNVLHEILTFKGDINFSTQRNTFDMPESSRLDDLVYKLQDKHIDTKRVVQAIRDAGKQIEDAWNPYLQEELYHGRSAKQVKDFLDFELRPLLQDMQLRGVTMQDFETYLHNRHAEEANRHIAEINPDMPDGGSGIGTADARKYLSSLTQQQRVAYEALAKRVDAINKNTRQLLVDGGLEKQATIDAWESAYQHYVPLFREDVEGGQGTGQGFSVRGAAAKKRTGSKKAVVDIIANIAMQRERQVTRVEKNKVSVSFLGMALQNPNEDFWTVDSVPMQRVVETRGGRDVVVERPDPMHSMRDNVIHARINGEDHFVTINDANPRGERMAQALKNLDADQLGDVLGKVGQMTRYFASINTQYNPIFGIINLIRDTQGAAINLSTTPLRGKTAAVMGNVVSALRGIYADVRDHRQGKVPSSQWAQLWEEFQREGGQTGYKDMYSTAKGRAEAIEGEMRDMAAGKPRKAWNAVFDWLSDYNETMENAVRLSAYKVAKESGMSNQQAASLAKNLTVNFNRKGQAATQVGALYAFFNASVQGTARMAETLRGPAGKKIIYGGLLLGSMQALLLAAAGFDDDEPKEFIRERNLIIPLDNGKYITIPMPLGFHVIPGLGRHATEFVMGGFKNPAKRVADVFGMFADAFNPVGNAGLSLQTITPTVVDPLAALAENKDWSGKQIAKTNFNPDKPEPGYLRAKDTASWIGKQISYALNLITGGTDYKSGFISPTPDQIDYLFGQLAGGVGREYNKIEQTIGSNLSGEELPLHKIPLVGRFVGDAKGQAGQAGKFYEAIRRINEHKAEIAGLREEKRSADVVAYIKDNPEAMLISAAGRASNEVAYLRRIKRGLLKQNADREKVRAVEERITASMGRFNEQLEKANKKLQ